MTRRQRWVIKVGSRLVAQGGDRLIRHWMNQVARIRKGGVDVIWVTSGAIATAKVGLSARKKSSFLENQAWSAIGQPTLMHAYQTSLLRSKVQAAQLLVTYHDLKIATEKKQFVDLIDLLLRWRIVPILNENDVAVRKGCQFRDNDSLAATISHYVKADRLILCTDVAGLYDGDPVTNADAQLIRSVSRFDAQLLKMAKKPRASSLGRGGMHSKLSAAREANRQRVGVWLVKGDTPNILVDIFKNKAVGTEITANRARRSR